MKSLTFIAVVLLLAGCASSRPAGDGTCDCNRVVRVPDRAFRTFLAEKGYAVKAGWRRMKATAEGCALREMECYNQDIRSLQGIELFPQLEQLTCSDNPIEELDLDALPSLVRLYGLDLPLRRFDASQCHQLKVIQFSHTYLDTLDLTPFPNLEHLLCIYTPLRALDLSPCPHLHDLYIRFTHIRQVDLTPCPEFWQIHALDTPLEQVIVTPEQYGSEIRVSVEDTVRITVRAGQ